VSHVFEKNYKLIYFFSPMTDDTATATLSLAQRLRTQADTTRMERQRKREADIKALHEALGVGLVSLVDGHSKNGQYSFTYARSSLIEYILVSSKYSTSDHLGHLSSLTNELLSYLKSFAEGPPQNLKWEEGKNHRFQCACEQAKPCTTFVTISW
jgi:hypothetical protein